jgi:hypothetical protein
MTKVFTDVQVFMNAAGQTTTQDNEEQSILYRRLINEEYNEFIDAVQKNDDVETADACFDTIWVIVGYMLSRGWKCDGIWDEGSLSNLKLELKREFQSLMIMAKNNSYRTDNWIKRTADLDSALRSIDFIQEKNLVGFK